MEGNSESGKQGKSVKMKTHQEIAREMDLFSIESGSLLGGTALYHPKGARMLDLLREYIKELHLAYGYQLVQTPHIFKNDLWKISGHYDKYKDKMFFIDDGEHAVKPMNCPAHTMIYKSRMRTYKELPMRLFEFGTVYRKEQDGEINGLLRCRCFTQDDSHIFIRLEDVTEEVKRIIKMADELFERFGMKTKFYLSSSPKDSLDDKLCGEALGYLKAALEESGKEFKFNEGEGAFYGPKIDVCALDSQGREWQLTTIQLDFNMPRRFDLKYQDREGMMKQPVIIHRAILGSIDRFFGVLLEDTQGWLPMLISPVNCAIIYVDISEDSRVNQSIIKHAQGVAGSGVQIRPQIISLGRVELGSTLNELRREKIPFCAIVGERELKNNEFTVKNLRTGEQVNVKLGKER